MHLPNRTARRALVLASLICLASMAATHAAPPSVTAPGRIVGRVSIGDDLKAGRMRFNLYPDLLRESALSADSPPADEHRNVVVYVEQAAVPLDHQPRRHVMEQRGGRFVPHVLPVMRGARVAFPNSDPLLHNVFSLSKIASFDLGRFPRDKVREVDFNQPGIVQVFCHIHADMNAVILVLDNPYFAVPDAEGRFEIEGVPPGDYVVRAWHVRARSSRGRAKVDSGQTASLEFHVPLSERTRRDR